MPNNYVILGYVQYALDALYLFGNPIMDDDRQRLEDYLYQAFDQLTEEEALEYFYKNSNSNLK